MGDLPAWVMLIREKRNGKRNGVMMDEEKKAKDALDAESKLDDEELEDVAGGLRQYVNPFQAEEDKKKRYIDYQTGKIRPLGPEN
jgi:hypothetical protein